ncbi:hypothetical protein EXIGLDRAFT_707886 [Exidia glandulosa HHB12029]|uniref:Peptidase A1 domain-containing protein n=1 Tax=Exidia glandulosa HHB12029 TaxID=1314781 RepID=A0A165Z3G4_EXIGL|nr:hypothetical protein EXIGLDRAFT_707886 [Exidia glandulosa HHB12029]
MGLSFSGPGASGIQHTLTAADSSLEFSSQTVLSNVFASDPSGRSFIAFDLGRDLPDGTPGDSTFSINEVPNAYLEAVNAAPRLPAFRSAQSTDVPRWAVSVDALVIAGNTMQTTSIIPDAPGGRALGVLDTGTSLAILPPDLVTAIYSSIPGAFLVKSPDQAILPDFWVIPCTARVSVSLVLGGQPIFIDPRDLVRPLPIPLKGVNTTICINLIPIQMKLMLPEVPSFDFLLGDVFLRNAFQLYDFNGNVEFDLTAPTQPYALLVPLTKEITDDGEYKAARQAALSGLPPEADITDPDFVPALQDAISSAGGMVNGNPSGAGGPEPGSSASSPDDGKKSSVAPRTAPVGARTFWLGSVVMFGLLLAEVVV